MPVKVAVARLHPCKGVLGEDSKPLLLGMGIHHLAPDGGNLRIHGDPQKKSEVDPLEGQYPPGSNSQGPVHVIGVSAVRGGGYRGNDCWDVQAAPPGRGGSLRLVQRLGGGGACRETGRSIHPPTSSSSNGSSKVMRRGRAGEEGVCVCLGVRRGWMGEDGVCCGVGPLVVDAGSS